MAEYTPWLFAAALVAAASCLGVAAWLWWHPVALVRGEYLRQARAAGFVRRTSNAGGARWRYVERAGDDPDAATIVMLHGYTGSKENFYRLAKALGRRHRLVLPDLPGWGESGRDTDADYGYAGEAKLVGAFLAEVAGDRPVVLVGHSMGGGVASVVAARFPDRVSHLALLDASGVHFADNAFGLDVLAGGNPFGVHDRASLEHYLAILFHERRTRPPMPWPASLAVIRHRRGEGAFEQSVLERIGRGPEQFLPGDEAARIRVPVLLLWGADDRVIDPSAMALYADRMPQARTVLLPACGHMAPMEYPAEVARAIEALIDERTPA